MEFHKKDDMRRRAQFVVSRAYSSQDISGKAYADLKKCYLICILNYPLFKEDTKYYRDMMFRDEDGTPLTDDEIIIFIELSKIESLLKKPVEELTDLEMWMIFFRYATDKSKRELLNKILEKEEGIEMALQILERMSLSEEERAGYEAVFIAELDECSARRALLMKVAKGLKEDGVPLATISKNIGLSLEEIEKL
jgi:predicted transposase/invertase (TIGR01784 family)